MIPVKRNMLSVMFLSHVEQALNSDKNQGQRADAYARPPRAQRAIELQDGDDSAVD
jgi:hypothetical protein